MTVLATVGVNNALNVLLTCNTCDRSFLKKSAAKTVLSRTEHFCSRDCVVKNKQVQSKKGKSRSITLAEVKKRLFECHGNLVKIIDESYVSVTSKATFIDADYGEWRAQVKSVINGRRHTEHKAVSLRTSRLLTHDEFVKKLQRVHKDTLTVKKHERYENSHKKITLVDKDYGEWNVMPYSALAGTQHPARAKKTRDRKSRLAHELQHWKTEEELVCVGSYEVAFVKWCNENQYDFDWQVPILTPWNRMYYIDAYVKGGPLSDTWVEIKGTWNRSGGHIGKRKWEWFHSTHKNSRLLMRSELLELEILP